MIPFIKWVGGKRWFVTNHSELLKLKYKRYFEPFLGSGAVYFYLQPEKAYLSDLNEDLIETYKTIRDEPLEISNRLKYHQKYHSKEHYYKVRSQKPKNRIEKSSRFIYLNRTCFNGLYRVNLKGEFNVPKGTKSNVVLPSDNFEMIAELLKRTVLQTCDFSYMIEKAEKGDLIYVDPPYTVKHNNNNFLKYNEKIFSWNDQQRLANCLLSAANRGAYVLVSNADHECIRELYSDAIWNKVSYNRFSVLASLSQKRSMTSELVISNYLDDTGGIMV